jgi:all-trans-retinol 13,14-reductase
MQHFDVIIIGSGLGSLLCGYILGKEGFRTCILEKQAITGGNLQTFSRHGHKFETGVHYIGALGPGQTLSRYWKYFGLLDSLQLQQLDDDGFDRISFGDHEYPIAQGFDHFTNRLLRFFPAGADSLNEYTRKIRDVVASFPLYNLELPKDHREYHYTSQSAFQEIEKLRGITDPVTGIPLSSVVSGNNYLYGGSSASPLHVASLINHSFITGAYRIIGGSDIVSKSLVTAITAMGGSVMTKRKVESIENLEQKFLLKTSNGEMFLSKMVVSGIHPAATLAMMPSEMVRPAYQKRIASLQNTGSSFLLFLSVRPRTFPYLNYNYYFHTTTDTWDESQVSKEQWPRMFLLSTACHKPHQEFAETVTILTYMRYDELKQWEDTFIGKRGTDYLVFKQEKADKLLDLVSRKFPGLRSCIEHVEISTPLTYRDYTGTEEGSLYGIQKSYKEPLLTTVMPKTKIPNFYFTGQNTNLHGVLGVTIGAVVTCGEILGLEYLMKKINHGQS